ncbi:MAG: hypothetical protein Q9161_005469 [Pseudevernia consocians]
MIPGKTYVGILPGHTRPAFVRKRPVDAGRPPLLLTQIFGSSRRAFSVEAPHQGFAEDVVTSTLQAKRRDPGTGIAGGATTIGVMITQTQQTTVTTPAESRGKRHEHIVRIVGAIGGEAWQGRHPGRIRAEYVDSATQYIEDLDPPRYLPRPRNVSRGSYIEDVDQLRYRSRPRSLSRVSCVEELERPRHRSRPRSVSRVSYIEDLDGPRSRRRARSPSQVRFVDETDEPVSLSKPRSLERRRVVCYDGPADTEKPEQQAYSPTPSNHYSSQGAATDDGSAVLVEKTITPHFRASPKPIKKDRGVELIEVQLISHPRPSSQSQEGFDSIRGTASDYYHRQQSETRPDAYESDHDATPRPAFRLAQVIQSPDDVEEPPSHHSSYIDFEGARSYERSYSPALKSREPSQQRMFTGPGTPYGERRERVRESDESSGPDDDDYPRPSPTSFRYVEAPEPPAPQSELLVEMLQNASITPPNAQYARGRPSRRNCHSELDTPGRSYPRRSHPSEDSEEGDTTYGGRRMTRERLSYGGPLPHEPEFKSNAEYDWMT